MKNPLLKELAPGPLPGKPVPWRCWKLEPPFNDRDLSRPNTEYRAGEPIVTQPHGSGHAACHEAARVFGCSVLDIDCEPILPEPGSMRPPTRDEQRAVLGIPPGDPWAEEEDSEESTP